MFCGYGTINKDGKKKGTTKSLKDNDIKISDQTENFPDQTTIPVGH